MDNPLNQLIQQEKGLKKEINVESLDQNSQKVAQVKEEAQIVFLAGIKKVLQTMPSFPWIWSRLLCPM